MRIRRIVGIDESHGQPSPFVMGQPVRLWMLAAYPAPVDPARDLGERGLSEAMERLRDRLDNGGWYQGPFTEALLWITSLKDFHGNGVDYISTEGKRLRALGWVRNYAAHDLLTLSNINLTISGLQGAGLQGMSLQGAGGRLVWVEESALPLRKKHEDDRRALYQTLVASHGVLEPLEMAQTYLSGLR
jgi:hypothetical protein